MMVRPANFGFNPETAASNSFQSEDKGIERGAINREATRQFDDFVKVLRHAGVEVVVFEDTDEPLKTDAVFPNNWVTFHQDGTIITYPMLSATRRLERREELLRELEGEFGFRKRIALESYEHSETFLEGTGSMILDRPNRLVYACRSPRTHERLLQEFCRQMDYEALLFHAKDRRGLDIYHTNVMMALAETFVVLCVDSIVAGPERDGVLRSLEKTGKELISITFDQMLSFAGNMLQVKGTDGQPFLVMSSQAYESLTGEQVAQIRQHCPILHSPLDVIEAYGGGSARCMMAEVFVPTGISQ